MTIAQVDTAGVVREKTVVWQDPMAAAELGRTLSGFDYLKGMVDGRIPLPPMASHFTMRWVSLAQGEVTVASTPDESLYNPIGMIHGGVAATLLDTVVGCAVHSTLPVGVGYSSVELKINYLRAMHSSTGEVQARGWVVKGGSRVAFAEADLRDADGKVYATASSTLLILKP